MTTSNNPNKDDEYKSSELLYEQAEYLLNDEIHYANTLRLQRSTTAGLLVVIVGIGLFRFELFVDKDATLPIATFPLFLISVLFTFAAILITAGTWVLFSERPIIKRAKDREKSVEADPDDGESPFIHRQLSEGKSSAALAVLNLHRHYRKLLEGADPVMVIRARTLILKVAYKRLAAANRRVRYRIEKGQGLLFSGLVVVFIAFLVYIWAISARSIGIGGGHGDGMRPQENGTQIEASER